MIRLFSTPVWFNGWDIIFDLVILLVALLIAAYSWRVYKFNQENRYAYFSLAFLFVALSLLFKAFTSSVLYYFPVRETVATVLSPVVGQGLSLANLYYRAAFFLQMASMLGAWLLIFFLSQKSRHRLSKFYEVSQIGLFIYLVLLISVVSNFHYVVFYLTSTVILTLVVLNYYKRYLNTKKENTLRIMNAFLLVLVGNVFFIFVFLAPILYAVGELFMLLGFLQILYTYMRIRGS